MLKPSPGWLSASGRHMVSASPATTISTRQVKPSRQSTGVADIATTRYTLCSLQHTHSVVCRGVKTLTSTERCLCTVSFFANKKIINYKEAPSVWVP